MKLIVIPEYRKKEIGNVGGNRKTLNMSLTTNQMKENSDSMLKNSRAYKNNQILSNRYHLAPESI